MRRLALVIVLLAASAGVASADPAPGTLGIEGMTGTLDSVNAHCNLDRSSHIQFQASGIATGPFPGTFVERGEITISPQLAPTTGNTGFVTNFAGSFRIDSPATDSFVTGTIDEILVGGKPDAACQDLENVDVGTLIGVSGTVRRVNSITVEYNATIHTPDGARDDQGRVSTTLAEQHLTFTLRGEPAQVDQNLFRQFLISLPPAGPQS